MLSDGEGAGEAEDGDDEGDGCSATMYPRSRYRSASLGEVTTMPFSPRRELMRKLMRH